MDELIAKEKQFPETELSDDSCCFSDETSGECDQNDQNDYS